MEDNFPRKRAKLARDVVSVGSANHLTKFTQSILKRKNCSKSSFQANDASRLWSSSSFLPTPTYIDGGGFGKVYKVVDKVTSEELALKILTKLPKNCSNTMNPALEILEFTVQLSIKHENVVKALGSYWYKPQSAALILEFCSMGTALRYMDGNGFPVTHERTRGYCKDIVSGVLHLHVIVNYLHMDLKPENVLISAGDVAKISDFGCVIKLKALRLVMRATNGGTQVYYPPEKILHGVFDSTYDVWCVGCIAFELALGRHPFYPSLKVTERSKPAALKKMDQALIGRFGLKFTKQPSTFQAFIKLILGSRMRDRPVSTKLQDCAWLKEEMEMKENQNSNGS